MTMDKGYYLLRALGFDEMARQARSTKDPTTSRDCLNFIIDNVKSQNMRMTALGCIERMDMDEEETR